MHIDFNLPVGQNSSLLSNSIIMSIIVLPQVLLSSFSGTGNLQAEFEHRAVSRQFKRPPRDAEGLQSDDGLFPWVNFWYLEYCDFLNLPFNVVNFENLNYHGETQSPSSLSFSQWLMSLLDNNCSSSVFKVLFKFPLLIWLLWVTSSNFQGLLRKISFQA